MPGLFEQFPHTNLHELNLDWLINMINQFKEELEDSAVLSVNGKTGHVTLYESENVILPALPSGVDQWRLVRLVNGQYVGILFYNGHAYIQRGNETMRLLTPEDIPSSSGVVSWNGLTGVVNVTGADIPVDDAADADSIEQAITNEHTERVNADNALQNSINTLNSNVTTLRNDLGIDAVVGQTYNIGNQNVCILSYGWNGLQAFGRITIGAISNGNPVFLPKGNYSISIKNNSCNAKKTDSSDLTSIVSNISSIEYEPVTKSIRFYFSSAPFGTSNSIIIVTFDGSITRNS